MTARVTFHIFLQSSFSRFGPKCLGCSLRANLRCLLASPADKGWGRDDEGHSKRRTDSFCDWTVLRISFVHSDWRHNAVFTPSTCALFTIRNDESGVKGSTRDQMAWHTAHSILVFSWECGTIQCSTLVTFPSHCL